MITTESVEAMQSNPMLKPRIDKVVVNVSVGKSGEPLEKAMKIIQELTEQKPCIRKAKKTIRDFGIRKNEPIACIVTLRGQKATSFLKKAFSAVDNKIRGECIDKLGNLSFGIKEHIDIPGVKYNPELGIIGMDICISLSRPGYRVKWRRRAKSKVGKDHLLTPEETISFLKEEFGVEIL
ncbi:MAG: 50S ribosomal protein L5 [Nitrososphaerota archaeon]|nr:50S ribosomal protein L5 [Candidatus Bathyarchaeota archaeon]MDW8048280.1 50S ribosomal protein L5 [Nitrososphaerota archaeon]